MNENFNKKATKKRKLNQEALEAVNNAVDARIMLLSNNIAQNVFTLFNKNQEKHTVITKDKDDLEYIYLYFEHYLTLKDYIENAEKENYTKDNISFAEEEIINNLMVTTIQKAEKDSTFSRVFKNIEDTKKLYNFLTNAFTSYIKDIQKKYPENHKDKVQNKKKTYHRSS